MSWADGHIKRLRDGAIYVKFRPHGDSMRGYIESGQLVTLQNMLTLHQEREFEVGDIVLAKVKGRVYLHRIGAVRSYAGDETVYRIENARGFVNGWTGRSKIYALLVEIAP